jgi:DNA-binding transcriptional LysR family regulator
MIETPLLPAMFSLLTVARTGSVSAAARHHHLTASAISQHIRRVEAQAGVRLLERAGRGVRLTAAAEAVLPALGRLRAEAETCFGELAALSERPVTTVRVAASDYLGKGLLVPVLRALVDEGAPVRFEIATTHSRDAIGRVARGEIEFGVVSADAVPAGLDARRLFDQAFVWVGARRRTPSPSLLERLTREPLLRLGAESHGRRLLDDFLARERISPVSTIDVTSVSLLLAYVSGGLGVGLAPTLALADVDARRVVVERAQVPAVPVQLISRPARVRSPAAARFADALLREGRRRRRPLPRRGPASPARGGGRPGR